MYKKPERLQKILSAQGITSRRDAERMIIEGRVSVNGVLATLGQSAVIGQDLISVDGMEVAINQDKLYIMLNKPRGFLTTSRDDRGRKTVMNLVSDLDTRIYPVGRLDINSEGLLLFTNDGEFANIVTHPSFEKKKVYDVEVLGDAENAALQLRQPLEIDGFTVHALNVELLEVRKTGGVLRITIAEGRNRQVRKMCNTCGVSVRSLKRISIGEIELGNLKTGQWRYLCEDEVRSVMQK